MATATATKSAKSETTVTASAQTALSFPGFKPDELYVYESDSALVSASDLVGVPFVVMNWTERESRFSDDGYISVEVIRQDGSLAVFNNSAVWSGSIRDVLRQHEARTGSRRGLVAPRGLREGINKRGAEPIYAFA